MSDPSKLTTKQESAVLSSVEDKKKGSKKSSKDESNTPFASYYAQGVSLLMKAGYIIDTHDSGDHCSHVIRKPMEVEGISGLNFPKQFKPIRDIYKTDELEIISELFKEAPQKVRDFWAPIFNPKPGESELTSFTNRVVKMQKVKERLNISAPVKLGHTFDPEGEISGSKVYTPTVWVPSKKWFDPIIHNVRFEDVFTIFPKAERKLLMLLLGRIGVGRSNHIPEGWDYPISHTARMAAVIVGKDPGLGKSTIFNNMISAFTKCGFVTQTFKNTKDRFGMKAIALGDIAYKDDTSLSTLKEFLSSEETKIMITNGRFQVEDKFAHAEQINCKSVFIVNSNDWNSKFAYDLDPGIIDRIKLISTYREVEIMDKIGSKELEGTVSEGSPDLRPAAHLPYLAQKLGVSQDALFLWCLRLSTDKFWEIINDKSDPAVNKLQNEVRYWTTRLRIRFKADLTQALVNSLAFSWAIRTGLDSIPELSSYTLSDSLEHFYFLGVDPSAQQVIRLMKERWEKAGRPSTHYYQGFREVRWDSVDKAKGVALSVLRDMVNPEGGSSATFSSLVKDTVEKLDFRDGFKIGGTANYIVESWENMRHGWQEIVNESRAILSEVDEKYTNRLKNLDERCYDDWIRNRLYSPDNAERLREEALARIYRDVG